MKPFIHDDFLLTGKAARELYHDHAKQMPIHDFHCHLPAEEIAQDSSYETLTQVWLGGDHYKWRAMRADGVDERLITGGAAALDKFKAWAEVVPRTVGNPLYHWTHLELKRYFEIDDLLEPDSAGSIYTRANELLNTPDFSVKKLLEKMNVAVICTTDDPADSLSHHQNIRDQHSRGEIKTKVVPAMRPDKAFAVSDVKAYNLYLDKLGAAADIDIRDYTSFIRALDQRHAFFHSLGARASDHALLRPVSASYTGKEVNSIFAALRSGKSVTPQEAEKLLTAGLTEIGGMNSRRGWVMQLHIGALRSINTPMLQKLGPDTGFDAIADYEIAAPLASFLDRLETAGTLPRTMVYNLNPRDNMAIIALITCFHEQGIPGKMQFGSGWWFNDQKEGMELQLKTLASVGLLSRFVGMLTDSRSFLSFPRHEYFRRILCNIIGGWADGGEAPMDMKLLGEMVRAVCYTNAENYFRI